MEPHSESRETAEADLAEARPAHRSRARQVYDRWRRAAHAIGVVQTRLIMLAIYAVVVVPTGMLMRRSRDPLRLRPPADSNWIPTRPTEHSVEAARRQY
ncbi:MAG: hypothetical protein AB7V27_05535 [Candidatus Binatia bacterium]